MILVFTVPVFADEDSEPVEEPAVVEETSKFLDHPIVQLLAQFFANFFNPPVEDEPDPVEGGESTGGEQTEGEEGQAETGGDTGEEGAADEAEEPAPVAVVPEEQVAAMHEEEKLGFGEITKLTSLAKTAQEICGETGDFCDVSLDSLMMEYKAGRGMGALFAKYGKPEHMGVGQVRKELNIRIMEKSNNGKSKNK